MLRYLNFGLSLKLLRGLGNCIVCKRVAVQPSCGHSNYPVVTQIGDANKSRERYHCTLWKMPLCTRLEILSNGLQVSLEIVTKFNNHVNHNLISCTTLSCVIVIGHSLITIKWTWGFFSKICNLTLATTR